MDCKQINEKIDEITLKMKKAQEENMMLDYWKMNAQRLDLMKEYNEQLKQELKEWPKYKNL